MTHHEITRHSPHRDTGSVEQTPQNRTWNPLSYKSQGIKKAAEVFIRNKARPHIHQPTNVTFRGIGIQGRDTSVREYFKQYPAIAEWYPYLKEQDNSSLSEED